MIELARILDESDFGILCVTRENLEAPWLHFEAGALSKSLEEGRVVPYLFELNPEELTGPLSQFQAVISNKEGTKRLVHAISDCQAISQRSISVLDDVFEKWWPDLESELEKIITLPEMEHEVENSPTEEIQHQDDFDSISDIDRDSSNPVVECVRCGSQVVLTDYLLDLEGIDRKSVKIGRILPLQLGCSTCGGIIGDFKVIKCYSNL